MKELYEVLKKSDYEMYKDDAVSVEEETAYIPSSDYRITKPIRLIELFAGIGSQAMALRNIGADFEHYRVVEFDTFAINSYNAIHGTNFPVMDITQTTGDDLGIINRDEYEYVMTYSFPCTDLSVAGKMEGMKKGSGTRSGLLWEVERLLKETDELPQVLLMENVPQVHGKDNIEDFTQWLNFLERIGYKNYYKDLNAKDYGVAQNRKRCFMVSILGEGTFTFPKKKKLDKTISDYLEEEVDEKYYIRNEKADSLINQLIENGRLNEDNNLAVDMTVNNPDKRDVANCIKAKYNNGISNQSHTGTAILEKTDVFLMSEEGYERGNRVYMEDGSMCALTAREYKGPVKVLVSEKPACNLAGLMDDEGYANDERVYKTDGSSPAIRSMGKAPNILMEDEIIKEYNKGAKHQQDAVQSGNGICKTIPTGTHASTPHLLKTVVAMRGRNPENPTSRVAGLPTEQRLEIGEGYLANTLTSVQKDNLILEQEISLKEIGNLNGEGFRCTGTVFDEEGLCPTIVTNGGGHHEPKILQKKNKEGWIKVRQATKKGYIECKPGGVADLSYPTSKLRRARVQDDGNLSPTLTCSPEIYRFEEEKYIPYNDKILDDVASCQTENCEDPNTTATVIKTEKNDMADRFGYAIRKLTPRECWRLFGFTDEDYDKAAAINSNSQLYKQAGNSIVVNCLEEIFKNLIEPPKKKVKKAMVTFSVYVEEDEDEYETDCP